jgi:hypothetical protein
MIAIAESKRLVVAASARNSGKHAGVDVCSRAGRHNNYGLQRCHAAAQPGRQNLFDFRKSAHRRLLDSLNGSRRGASQAKGDRNSLVVIEQQRRHGGPGAELVPAFRARRRMDRIAQGSEFVDVAAQGPAGDFQPIGEVGPRPVPAALKQREQPEKARGCFQHESSVTLIED